ncbi:MFS transporter [Pantoea sp. ME81]|uniref:MFS transporter n=1 Tax=Pantoea sp. ME81 TaxID=2743935 RepID=UPI0015F657B5|nr:MFS transporter [Pantoea sp. ME81]
MDANQIRAHAAQRESSRVRYMILFLLFIITTITYADRATLSVTAPQMKDELGITSLQMGYIFSAFSWSYVIAQLPSGWILDKFGSKRVYFWAIALWSFFTLMQGTVGWISSTIMAAAALFVLRLLMGFAEAPAFPTNAKVVSAWFPVSERGTASAVFNSGQYFAAVAFTPLMAWLTHYFGWHVVYVVMGVVGFILAIIWLKSMRDPVRHPSISQAELDLIEQGGGTIDSTKMNAQARTQKFNWGQVRQLLGSRMMIGVYIAQFFINVLTYFFITWFPIYLVEQRGMNILEAGMLASLPAICGFSGGILGGVFSDALLRRGFSLTAARKTPIVLGMLLASSIILCNYTSEVWVVIALMSVAFFGKGLGALGWAVVADTSPKEAIGLSGSLFNTFGNIAGIVTPIVIGYIISITHSYNGALIFVGVSSLATMLCYLLVVKDIKRMEFH